MLQNIVDKANLVLDVNKGCYVAMWILQNPNENISDYSLQYKPSITDADSMEFKMIKGGV